MTIAKTRDKTVGNGAVPVALDESFFRFPDPPERTPDDMTNFKPLIASGNVRYLIRHFGNPETTLVAGDHYLSLAPTQSMAGVRYPDLLIAFDVDPALYEERNAYVISDQGKPPDFVLEIASQSTGRADVIDKRAAYAALGIPEYWRFDETGEYHGTRLAGDRLVDGSYEPILVTAVEDEVLQGHSGVLNLDLRWEHGRLEWHDPETSRRIITIEDVEARAEREWQARMQAQARADEAEARAKALEAEVRRLRGG